MKKFITPILLIIFCTLILALSIRGIPGSPNENTLNETYWTEDGPLELSPERGKFALTYSVVEDKSVIFSLPVANFATPDLGYHNGNYVSLFPPGVSYITIPGYIIGKFFGASQLGTYAIIGLFAVLNAFLIRAILIALNVKNIPATISSIIFLFATPAFAYGSSLYQHHISTFMILSCVFLFTKFKGIWPLLITWFILAASLTVDSPNFFLFFPIGIYSLSRIFKTSVQEKTIKLSANIFGFFTIVTAFLPILLFGYFNFLSYGNPMQLSGTVAGVRAIDSNGLPTAPENAGVQDLQIYSDTSKQDKHAVNFFLTRNLLNGFYLHLFSPDRGIIYYTPVMFLGLIGAFYLYKKNSGIAALLVGIVGTNFLLYSMWVDPWGGWAFGSRYLIPSYAILSIFIGFTLLNLNRYLLFTILFLPLLSYSVMVNTVGAITSSRNPPQVEVLNLEEISGVEQKYTYDRNFAMLNSNSSKSFLFGSLVKNYMTAWQYYYLLIGLILFPVITLTILDKILRGGLHVKFK